MDVVIQNKTLTVNVYNKERYLGYVYILISFVPFVFYRTESTIEFACQIVFFAALWWAALLALAEKEFCVVNKEKNVVRVTTSTLFNQRQFVHNLDDLLDIKMEQVNEGKKNMHRIVFHFNDGIEIPLTTTYYSDQKQLNEIIKKIDNFVG
jgi:DNA-binding transcriptional regulator WhiA